LTQAGRGVYSPAMTMISTRALPRRRRGFAARARDRVWSSPCRRMKASAARIP